MVIVKRAAYTENTLEQVAAGLALLLAQQYIVTNPFFDEKEIKQYLLLRRQFHADFVQACVDLAQAFEDGQFGSGVKPAIPALKAIGHLTVRQEQQALRQMTRAFRGLKNLSYQDVDNTKLLRLIAMARRIDNTTSSSINIDDSIKRFLATLVKVSVLPPRLKTLLRKVIKLPPPGSWGTDNANPGAWFDMPEDKKKSLRELTEKTEKERDEGWEKHKDDPEKRQQIYVDTARRLQKIQNLAGVNLGVIKKQETAASLEQLLKLESKMESDGPTEFVRAKIEAYLKDTGVYYARHKRPKEGAPIPREIGKVLTNLKKAKTFSTMQRCVKDAVDRNVLGHSSVEDVEHIIGQAGKNRAIREGKPLTPLRFEPKTVEQFQAEHDTGVVEFDPEYSEEERLELLGRVSRAISDLESVYGKGFCGKHSKKLAFRFKKGFSNSGAASAHYFTDDDRREWQPRVTFGSEYQGLLAHELSHYLEDLLSARIDMQVDPEGAAKNEQRGWGAGSGVIFGRTGVALSLFGVDGGLAGSRSRIGETIPEFVEFIDAVLATPDYKRWADKLGSAYDVALPGAIKNLTGMEYWDLPKDHPYYGLVEKAQYRSDLPPELNDATQKYFKALMGGDDRKLSYYNSATEIWARMCEQYVYNRLIDGGVSNPWLTQMSYDDDIFMDEKVFDEQVRPVMDRLFARVKGRSLLASKRALEIAVHVLERFTGVEGNRPSPGHEFSWDDNDSLADALDVAPADLPSVKVADWTSDNVPAAMKVVTRAIQTDAGYLYGWHDNLAMSAVDEGVDRETANKVAQRFLRQLFEVDSKNPQERVAAKYQEKKKVPKANGKGTTEVYVYSEKQVQNRNREKAERLQNFKPKVEKLRAKYKKDLSSTDDSLKLTALVVALIDETHERIGSPESAKGDLNDDGEAHFGVSQWLKKHITLSDGKATIRYVGKSGVDQEKEVSTPHILAALRDAVKSAEGKESKIFEGVTSAKVNEYLEEFGVSAKDLRGLAANGAMQKALKRVRSKGGKLPSDKKEREKKLKEEFKDALEEVAEEIGGHEPATLANQYLAPKMRAQYEKDGTIIEKLDE